MKTFLFIIMFIFISTGTTYAYGEINKGTLCINGYLFAYVYTSNGNGGKNIQLVQIFKTILREWPSQPITCK